MSRTHTLLELLAALVLVALGCSTTPSAAQDPSSSGATTAGEDAASTADPAYVYPVIAEHGRALPIPSAAFQPDPALTYRVVFDVTAKPSDPGEVNPGLAKIARFVNLWAAAGVAPEQMELVAVLHGGATDAAMNDEAYRERHQRANPNAALLAALADAGVDLYVCGQALAHNGIGSDEVAEPLEVALAALTVTTNLQLRGWAVLRF